MRALFAFAMLLPCPALADVIAAQSRVTDVTVYPYGAEITRVVELAAPAGAHEVLITDIPGEIDPNLLRFSPGDGVSVGAFALRTDRLPPRDGDAVLTPAQVVAKANVERVEQTLREAQAGFDAANARIEAAEAQIGFLRGVAGQTSDTMTAESLRAISGMISAEVLAARQAAIAAQADLYPAQKALEQATQDLADAQAALVAESGVDQDYAALSVSVVQAADGKSTLTVKHFVEGASWRPVYDMNLTRKDAGALAVARGVLVSQESGEDWAGVILTLSTAQPSAQAAPSTLWPDYREITAEENEEALALRKAGADMMMAEPVATAPDGGSAITGLQGDTVVYRYPTPVNVATGIEDLRLALDEIVLAPKIEAWAVPRADRTAFVMATFTNTAEQILLPGTAYLMREGVFVGTFDMPVIAAGEQAKVPFGAIEGLRLKRDMPVAAQGDRGVFITATERTEQAVLHLENLTQDTWPVRLLDQVPYAEQEDLEITFTADPAPSVVDVDGQRGILGWDFTLAPGEEKQIPLTTTMRWPEGMDLR